MRLTHFTLAALLTTALASPALAEDSVFSGWDIYGNNTARYEAYDIGGDPSASPYPHRGSHMYDEFDVNFARQFSPYKRLRGQIFGLVNGSDYRQIDDGIVPERLNIQFENGESSVPYRVEAGDYFANLSYRTMQRSLKGAQVELQPDFGNGQRRHSFLMFSGAQQPYWRHFDTSEDYHTGASWLIEDAKWGRFSLNSVHNYRDAQAFGIVLPGNEDAQNWLNSAAFQTPFDFGTQKFSLEGELSHFAGDYGATTAMQEKDETGYFTQLSGRGTGATQPLDYRFRFEQYGNDYRPTGAVVTPDRRSEEAHMGWRFDNGLRLRGRAQFYQDQFDSTNERRTDILGAGVNGPASFLGLGAGSSMNFDYFHQDTGDQLLTFDFDADTFSLNVSTPLTDLWTGQADLYYQVLDDSTATNRDRVTKQIGFSFVRSIMIGDWAGSIAPGFLVRDIDGSLDDAMEWQPTLAIDLSNGNHMFTASYGFLAQNRLVTGVADVGTQTFGLDYRYLMDNHEFGIYANIYDRDQDFTMPDTNAERVGVYWTYRFDNSGRETPVGATELGANGQVPVPALNLSGSEGTGQAATGAGILAALTPGQALATAEAAASRSGLGQPTKIGGVSVYESRLLKDVSQRQRLALEPREGRLNRATLIIEADDTGSGASLDQLYAQARDSLIAAYGQPQSVYDQGNFGANPLADLNGGRVTRISEWQTQGGKLRLGIPARVDGQIRIEAQHAREFPSPRSNRWGTTVR